MRTPIPMRTTDLLQKLALFSPSLVPPGIELAPGEEPFGLYRNNIDVPTKSLLLTSEGAHVQFVGHAQFVPYNDIVDMVWHTWERKELETPENRCLILELRSGEKLDIHIVGMKGIGLDLSNMHNFLLGAVQVRTLDSRRVIRKQ